jgi:hypothetical protein
MLMTHTLQLINVRLPEPPAPLAYGFVGDDHAADEQEFFHVAMAQVKPVAEPDSVTDDLPRNAMMFRQYQGLWCSISPRSLIEGGRCLCQAMRKSPSVPGVYDR